MATETTLGVVRAAANHVSAGITRSGRTRHATTLESTPDEATFDSLAVDFDFATFLAAPVAFTDDEGNRLRPAVTTITALKADGAVLGSIDQQGILDLNGPNGLNGLNE